MIHAPTPSQSLGSDPRVSSWVTASAGSGKTRVLADRVLRLLLAEARADGILCLTFTKAAAAEMTQRVTEALSRWATAPDAELEDELGALQGGEAGPEAVAKARTLLAAVLDAPSGVRIQTIHAFCQSLLGRFPLESGVATHFQVVEDRTAAEMLEDARDAVLRRSHSGALKAAVAVLAARWNEGQAAEALRTLSADRTRVRRLLAAGVGAAVETLRGALGVAPGATADSAVAEACRDGAFDTAALRRVAGVMTDERAGKTDRRNGATLTEWLDAAAEERSVMFRRYLAAFFTKNGRGLRAAKLIHATAMEHAVGGEGVLEAEVARLEVVRARLRRIDTLSATKSLLRFLAALFDEYEGVKSRHARLDYDDLILRAAALLQRPGIGDWVQFKLDGGIDHVLIDEAQDTSPDQWDVIDLLTREFFAGRGARDLTRTVFAVGDPKQSIYGFRGADPASFARWRESFGQRVEAAEEFWRPRDLLESFRSTEPILLAVDAVFAPEESRRGLLFGADTAIRHIATRRGQAGCVEIWDAVAPAEAGMPSAWDPPRENRGCRTPSARLAARISDRIREWLDGAEMLPTRGRPLRPGDIMILVQRRTAFVDEMIRELKQQRVPVAGIDRMVITEQLAVMDLLALARFVLWPEDELNLAVVLKGPFVGLSEDELFELAHGRSGNLWRALRERAREHLGYAAAVQTLAARMRRADSVPPHTFFAELLANGGRRRLLARIGPEANDPVDELLARALDFERTHAPSLQGFLRWIEAGQTDVKREQEPGRDEVRVMTVHGAKGLQAPVVFLPDSIRVAAVPEPVQWDDDATPPMLLWPRSKEEQDEASARARGRNDLRQDEEYRRLLYVAMTRAEDRLIVCGWDTQRKRRAGNWYDRIFKAAVGLPFDCDVLPCGVRRWSSPQTAAPDRAVEAQAAAAGPVPLPAWAKAAAPPEPAPATPLTPSRPAGDEPAAFSPRGAAARALRRGVLIHRLLQLLPELPEGRREAAAARLLAVDAAEFSESDRAEMTANVLAVLSEPGHAGLFGPGSRAEVPVAGRIGDVVVAGQVDRLVVGADEVLLVDYKTHRPAPRTPAEIPSMYVRQMAAYRAALRRVYPGRPVRCALLWTDGPRWMDLSEDALNACGVPAE